MSIHCHHFVSGNCRSCSLIELPYPLQSSIKQQACEKALVAVVEPESWLPLVKSAQTAFRNKAKMVVSGSDQQPILGLVNARGEAVDLSDCLLYPMALQVAFEPIRAFIRQCQLMPYDVKVRTGELKFVLVTLSEQTDELMVRFVLRSKSMLNALQQALPSLQAALPSLRVVSVNIQPVAMAIMEGEEEIVLTPESRLTMWLNDLPLLIQPKSFFQTNDVVAAALYRQALSWISDIQPNSLWDLFCGVGGFALHAAQVMTGQVTGIEVSAQAIASATESAQRLGLSQVSFRALSASDFALEQSQLPQAVIINPPRRGIGSELCRFLNEGEGIEWLIYSSCNPESLAKDLALMPAFKSVKAQVFDMFPHTHHAEVLVLLRRSESRYDMGNL
jgi:23S rRNA (uracil747-C5)-methyltransferase